MIDSIADESTNIHCAYIYIYLYKIAAAYNVKISISLSNCDDQSIISLREHLYQIMYIFISIVSHFKTFKSYQICNMSA